MESIPSGGGRRLRATYDETAELRRDLFDWLAGRRTYQNLIAQDLRPVWRQWTKAAGVQHDNRLFYELKHFASAPRAPEPLCRYVAAVERAVGRSLHLTDAGTPAAWAGNFVHAAVEPRSGKGEPSPAVPHIAPPPRPVEVWFDHAVLSIDIDPRSLRVAVINETGAIVAEAAVSGANGYGADDWEKFAKDAHRMLTQQLVEMRASYERENAGLPSFRFRNAASQQRHRDLMPALGDWLLTGHRPGNETRDSLRHLTKVIGIDLPRHKARYETARKLTS